MSKIYTRNFRVRWSEIDPTGQVSPSYYLRYLVETASDWGATRLGEDDIEAHGQIWVVRETEFTIVRPLQSQSGYLANSNATAR